MRLTLLVIFLALGFGVHSSETTDGIKKDFAKFKKEMSAQMDEAEKKLKSLKSEGKAKGSETKKKAIQEIEETRDELRSQLKEVKEEGGTKWKEFKKGFAQSLDQLNKKIQKALQN